MNDMQLGLQQLAADDVDAVSALARTVWQATYPPLISQAQIDAMLAKRYAPRRIHEQLNDPRHAWRVAQLNGVMVGFAHALLDESGCKLDKLYVHPGHQRRGIGAALIREVGDWARAAGALPAAAGQPRQHAGDPRLREIRFPYCRVARVRYRQRLHDG